MAQMMTSIFTALAALVSIAPAAAQQAQSAAKQGPPAVHIDLHEWGLGLDGRATIPGNEAVFEIRNTGSIVHSFEIEGKIDGKEVEVISGRLQPSQTTK